MWISLQKQQPKSSKLQSINTVTEIALNAIHGIKIFRGSIPLDPRTLAYRMNSPHATELEDLAKFCTEPADMFVFGADPTFNFVRFNVTVTSYTNLKVVEAVSGHHPAMIGPMLISQTKLFDAYNHFCSKIISLNKETRGIPAFGTDGEEELYRAMKFSFPYAVHLRSWFFLKYFSL